MVYQIEFEFDFLINQFSENLSCRLGFSKTIIFCTTARAISLYILSCFYRMIFSMIKIVHFTHIVYISWIFESVFKFELIYTSQNLNILRNRYAFGLMT